MKQQGDKDHCSGAELNLKEQRLGPWGIKQGARVQLKLPSTSGLQLKCRATLGHPDAWGGRG